MEITEPMLRKLYLEELKSISEITAIFGIPRHTLYKKLYEYRLTLPQLPARLRAKMKKAIGEKVSRAKAGKKMSLEHRIKAIKNLKHGFGEGSTRWKGGRYTRSDGYIYVMQKGHPKANRDGYVLEHILVAENKLGRNLLDGEVVHHINGIRSDNRDENLIVLKNQSEHKKLHGWPKKSEWYKGKPKHRH